jgi:hypothetical protein
LHKPGQHSPALPIDGSLIQSFPPVQNRKLQTRRQEGKIVPLQIWNLLRRKMVASGMLFAMLPGILLAGCNVTASREAQPPENAQLSGSEDPSATLRAEPHWFACRADSDCVVEAGVCGQPQALNKNFIIPYRDFRVQLEQMVECAAHPGSASQDQAQCVKQRCTVKGAKTPPTPTAP